LLGKAAVRQHPLAGLGMIGRLSGVLLDKAPPSVLVDVGGVGYEVDVPMSTYCELPDAGAKVVLLTQFIVREDDQSLYGFLTAGERDTFRQLIRISGIGARIALAVLSGMSVDEFAAAIAGQQVTRLVKIPGIGRKTAERLVLELKDKLAAPIAVAGAGPIAPAASEDVLRALVTLGYSEKEAGSAVRALPPDIGVADGIRQALRLLGKA
jgi:Holliday junction DNA helicase RuvA